MTTAYGQFPQLGDSSTLLHLRPEMVADLVITEPVTLLACSTAASRIIDVWAAVN